MKNKIITLAAVSLTGLALLAGCSEADRVSYNVSKEADNFQCS